MKSKILETINFGDINNNDFNGFLEESLDYQQNIVFTEEHINADNKDYKQLYNITDIDIQFREENDYDDGFDIAVYCKVKGTDKWLYLDNITREFYQRKGE